MSTIATPPLAIVIPGFGRNTASVISFARRLAGRGWDVGIRNLPGHETDEPMLSVLTMDTLVEHFHRTLPPERAFVLIGESLGGLVALALAARPPSGIAAVFAIDPPLVMENQQALRSTYWHSDDRFGLWAAYAEPIFGLTRTENSIISDDRDYRHLLADRPLVPVHIIAGEREDGPMPTTLDAEDRHLIATAPGFTLHGAGPSVGHVILDEAPDFVATLVAETRTALA